MGKRISGLLHQEISLIVFLNARLSSAPLNLVYFFFKDLFLFYVYGCFACTHVCGTHVYLVPMKTRRGHQIPWNWSDRMLQTIMPLLGTEFPGPLEEQPSALNH